MGYPVFSCIKTRLKLPKLPTGAAAFLPFKFSSSARPPNNTNLLTEKSQYTEITAPIFAHEIPCRCSCSSIFKVNTQACSECIYNCNSCTRSGYWLKMNYSLTIFFLPIGLRSAKARQFLGGFGVDNGRVAALQVLCYADCMPVSFLQFPFGKIFLKVRRAICVLH